MTAACAPRSGVCDRDLEDLCVEFEDICGPLFPLLPNKREDLPTI